MFNVIMENKAIILGALLAVSEALALIPAIKANSVFQLVLGALLKVKALLLPSKE